MSACKLNLYGFVLKPLQHIPWLHIVGGGGDVAVVAAKVLSKVPDQASLLGSWLRKAFFPPINLKQINGVPDYQCERRDKKSWKINRVYEVSSCIVLPYDKIGLFWCEQLYESLFEHAQAMLHTLLVDSSQEPLQSCAQVGECWFSWMLGLRTCRKSLAEVHRYTNLFVSLYMVVLIWMLSFVNSWRLIHLRHKDQANVLHSCGDRWFQPSESPNIMI